MEMCAQFVKMINMTAFMSQEGKGLCSYISIKQMNCFQVICSLKMQTNANFHQFFSEVSFLSTYYSSEVVIHRYKVFWVGSVNMR